MSEGRRYRGLLIGNATFPRDPHALPALNGPGVDIEQLTQALTDERVGLFRTEDLQQLPDHGIQDIREQIDGLFATAAREDVLLLYYSGHGQLDERGTLYLCAKDTSASRLRATALSAIEINNMIDGSAATTTVVILDCCHSGAFKGAPVSAPAGGRGRYVITSSRSTQLTLAATSPGRPSPFTGLLVRGLQHAKAPGDLTVVELYRQVHRWMTEEAVIAPQLKITGEGDVVIARRPHSPRPMPPTESAPTAETGGAAGRGPTRRTLILSAAATVSVIGVPTSLYLASDPAHPSTAGSKLAPSPANPTTLTDAAKVESVVFSPDGKTLASGSDDSTIRLWDVATEHRIHTLKDTASVFSVAFSPDGKTLASGNLDGTIRLRDTATARRIHTLTGHTNYVLSVAFSPNGKTLASASFDNTIRLWNVASQRNTTTLHNTNSATSVAYSPDGKTLASASSDSTIGLWDVATAHQIHTLTGHTLAVKSVAFSPDGKTLASGSFDNTIRLWRLT
ncbi:caspase family protein [Streptomyces sp. NPDC057889]|uniref:caspase, EACC1-associated type n=1 Tax=Streptomyces sp. NPDC057889 TaxID=3346272 RepID=UPI0036946C2A